MNVRKLQLDIDKAIARPTSWSSPRPSTPSTPAELARWTAAMIGVEAVNITVAEVDIETVGNGSHRRRREHRDVDAVISAIEKAAAAPHL